MEDVKRYQRRSRPGNSLHLRHRLSRGRRIPRALLFPTRSRDKVPEHGEGKRIKTLGMLQEAC